MFGVAKVLIQATLTQNFLNTVFSLKIGATVVTTSSATLRPEMEVKLNKELSIHPLFHSSRKLGWFSWL